MSKRFKTYCPVCKDAVLHFTCTKAEARRRKSFTTECGICGAVLVVDIPNKRQVNVEKLTFEYQGRELEPTGYVTI